MSAVSTSRGHQIEWNEKSSKWIYSDTREEVNDLRPCKKCGQAPTAEGHDACLGTLAGTDNACCGHGCDDGYMR